MDSEFLIKLFDTKLRAAYGIAEQAYVEAPWHQWLDNRSLMVQYVLPEEDIVIHTEFRIKKGTILSYPS